FNCGEGLFGVQERFLAAFMVIVIALTTLTVAVAFRDSPDDASVSDSVSPDSSEPAATEAIEPSVGGAPATALSTVTPIPTLPTIEPSPTAAPTPTPPPTPSPVPALPL